MFGLIDISARCNKNINTFSKKFRKDSVKPEKIHTFFDLDCNENTHVHQFLSSTKNSQYLFQMQNVLAKKGRGWRWGRQILAQPRAPS